MNRLRSKILTARCYTRENTRLEKRVYKPGENITIKKDGCCSAKDKWKLI